MSKPNNGLWVLVAKVQDIKTQEQLCFTQSNKQQSSDIDQAAQQRTAEEKDSEFGQRMM